VAVLVMVASLLSAVPAGAATPANPHERGPDPTDEGLASALGPFGHTSITVPDRRTPGFGAATIYHPTGTGHRTFGAVAVVPGFTGTQLSIRWYGALLASHGFVAITFDTTTLLDQPAARSTQLLAALDHLVSPASPVAGMVDPRRLAVMGHSMGGGGAIQATARRTSIKASVALTPWHLTKSWPGVRTPTLVIGARNDLTAPVAVHARLLYAGLPATIDKAYAELRRTGHFVPVTFDPTVARLSVAWLKRFVDDDRRYDHFLCPPPTDVVTFTRYAATCPYRAAA
jgi:dienelactone hydrolase